MSAILGIFSRDARFPMEATILRMLGAMSSRGSERCGIWRDAGVVLAVTRHGWELGPDFSGTVMAVQEGDLAVVADASLYYREELQARLEASGVRTDGSSPAHLILAAYRAWGDACADHLEGDYAFILWDARKQRIFCSRDFGGRRPLFYAEIGSTFIVASSVSGVLAHPQCSSDLNMVAVGQSACGLFASDSETSFRAARRLGAGWSLSRTPGTPVAVSRHWHPVVREEPDAAPFDEAADELRNLLSRAVSERLSSKALSTVWLSGGFDSTAVFASGQRVLTTGQNGRQLQPVSISYPVGDRGREDELIEAIAERWNARVAWLDINRIPLLDDAQELAFVRDEPFAHTFEGWNRALARQTGACGAHVALDGVGGDFLFQVSEVYFADLFRSGHWITLQREWHDKGMKGFGFRNFFRCAIHPVLPPLLLRASAVVRGGRPLRWYMDRPIPGWIEKRFVEAHDLRRRERLATPYLKSGSRAACETYWYLTNPMFPRASTYVSALALEEGVEVRSPLYDRRVVEFALSRPRWERSSGPETKRLLRHAMKGLLPDHVLAPRRTQTGTTDQYFVRAMRAEFPTLLNRTRESFVLADIGIVDAGRFWNASEEFLRYGRSDLGLSLYFTLQTELWLRGRAFGSARTTGEAPLLAAVAEAS